MEKCWGGFLLALVVFLAEIKKQDAKKNVTCMVQIHEVAKKYFLLEKEPVLRKKGSGEKSSAEEGRDDINTTIRR